MSKSVDLAGGSQNKERELFHVRVLVSLIRKNKNKIKSTYLNDYNLQKTTLPNVLQTLTALELFEDVRFQFQPATENERFEDEFQFITEEIRKLEEEVKESPYQPDSLAVIEAKPFPVYYLFYQNFPTAIIQNYLNEYLLSDVCPGLSEMSQKKEDNGAKAGKVVDLSYREPFYYKVLKQRAVEPKKPEPVPKLSEEVFVTVVTKSAKRRAKKYKKQRKLAQDNEYLETPELKFENLALDEEKIKNPSFMIESEDGDVKKPENIDLMFERAKSEQPPKQSLLETLTEHLLVQEPVPAPVAKDIMESFQTLFCVLPSEIEVAVTVSKADQPLPLFTEQNMPDWAKVRIQNSKNAPSQLSNMSQADIRKAIKLIQERMYAPDESSMALSEEALSQLCYGKQNQESEIPSTAYVSSEQIQAAMLETQPLPVTKKTRKNKRKKRGKATINEASEDNVNNPVTKGIQTIDYSFQQSDYAPESHSVHAGSRVKETRNASKRKSISMYTEVKDVEKQLNCPNLIEKIQLQLQRGAEPINNVEYTDLCESALIRTWN